MPDQPTSFDVADLNRLDELIPDGDPPARLAVIGDPVDHSASPQMHNPALQTAGIDVQYIRVKVSGDQIEEALKAFQEAGFIGINVTIPHKTAVLPFIDRLDPLAERIGAANTLIFRDGEIYGFNSDAPGLRQAIRDEFAVDLSDLRILIFGAGGGAGRAAAMQCAKDRCERLVLVNRTFDKAEALVEELRDDFVSSRFPGPLARLQALEWDPEAVGRELEHIDLVINATNLGMRLTDPDFPGADRIQPHHLVYDMVYSPPETRLMETARAAGAKVANGASMLLWQGAVSYEYWFDRKPSIPCMRSGLGAAS